jgi:hypothetical protein
MPTARVLWFQAKECLELADRANEFFVKTALTELAQELSREAQRVERRESMFPGRLASGGS